MHLRADTVKPTVGLSEAWVQTIPLPIDFRLLDST